MTKAEKRTAGRDAAGLRNRADSQPGAYEREKRRLESVAQNKVDAEPVLSALAAAGLEVSSISELLSRPDYLRAVPILLEYLPRIDNLCVKESIVRTLSVPAAKAAARPLLREFLRAPLHDASLIKWAIGNGLEVLAGSLTFEELAAIVKDKAHGRAREMVVLGLAKIKDPRVVGVLVDLLDDEEVAGHAIIALGRIKSSAARSSIERFIHHSRTWVRNEAKKAIAKIDKAAAKSVR